MDLMGIRRHIMLAGALQEHTVTGNPVQFITDAAVPFKSCKVGFLPVQNGSGDPSPSNIRPITGWDGVTVFRSGKNLFDKNATSTENGYEAGKYLQSDGSLANSSNYNVSEYIRVEPNKTYTLSGITGSNPSMAFYDENKVWQAGGKYNSWDARSMTTGYNIKYCRVSIPIAKIDELQLEVGNAATTYEPYTGYNSYPVSWASESTLPASGKNLFNESTLFVGYYATTNVNSWFEDNRYRALDMTLPAGTYTISTDLADCRFLRAYYDSTYVTVNRTSSYYTFTITTAGRFAIVMRNTSTSEITETVHVMIEKGSTATTYEPYTNAIAGGYINLATGEVWETWHKFWFKDIPSWTASSTTGVFYSIQVPSNYARDLSDGVNVMCNKYKTVDASTSTSSSPNGTIQGSTGYGRRIYVKDTSFASLDAFKAGTLDDYFVWQLATPILLGVITPTQIKALIKNNVVWSNTNDNIEVVYFST